MPNGLYYNSYDRTFLKLRRENEYKKTVAARKYLRTLFFTPKQLAVYQRRVLGVEQRLAKYLRTHNGNLQSW